MGIARAGWRWRGIIGEGRRILCGRERRSRIRNEERRESRRRKLT